MLAFVPDLLVNFSAVILYNTLSTFPILVRERKVEQEPFPAVSICHEKSWKWPGIIKAAASIEGGESYDVTAERLSLTAYEYFSWGAQRSFATRNEFNDENGLVDYCKIYEKVNKNMDDIVLKDLVNWLLDYAKQIQTDTQSIDTFNQNVQWTNFNKIFRKIIDQDSSL